MKHIAPGLLALSLALAGPSLAQEAAKKNWTPPPGKIYAQALSDQIMKGHPELLSVTFHGVPPGLDKTYTMFAGSYPDRIGNPDDPDDIDVIVKGITIIDPRWKRSDPIKKFVIQEPLRDQKGENVGLIVFAFKVDGAPRSERSYTLAAMDMRDTVAKEIPGHAALFQSAK